MNSHFLEIISEIFSLTHKAHLFPPQTHHFLPDSELLNMFYPLPVQEHSSSPPSLPSYLISTQPCCLQTFPPQGYLPCPPTLGQGACGLGLELPVFLCLELITAVIEQLVV